MGFDKQFKKRCPSGKKSVPTNKNLYNRIKNTIKNKPGVVWPSFYASGQVVQKYIRSGGKYRCQFGEDIKYLRS